MYDANPHDERMNAYYVSAHKHGAQAIASDEGDTYFDCCARHLREHLTRQGYTRIRIRRAWDYERAFKGGAR
jgi:hypothetical protein